MKSISKKITCMLLSPVLAAVMILGTLSMLATGCGDEEDSKPNPAVCQCPIADHLGIGEDCYNTADCACTLKVYGELYVGGPKIYRMGEVSETDMADAVTKAQDGYVGLTPLQKTQLDGKIDELYMLAADDVNTFYKNMNGKLVLAFKFDRSSTAMGNRFSQIASGSIVPE